MILLKSHKAIMERVMNTALAYLITTINEDDYFMPMAEFYGIIDRAINDHNMKCSEDDLFDIRYEVLGRLMNRYYVGYKPSPSGYSFRDLT